MPPISCTSKWRMPSARLPASRTTAKASGSRSSRVCAVGQTLAELVGLALQRVVRELADFGFERVDADDRARVLLEQPFVAAAEDFGQDFEHDRGGPEGSDAGSEYVPGTH